MDVAYKIFAFLCFVLNGAASIPYVPAAILKLPHFYLRRTIVLLDIFVQKTIYTNNEMV